MSQTLLDAESAPSACPPLQILSQNKRLYGIEGWGEEYFDINEKGHVSVRPENEGSSVDLYEIVRSLIQRGMEPPILFRFDGIIKDRLKRICSAFESAIRLHRYRNLYRPAYPIKVNQQKQIIDVIRKAGKEHHLALEVGSKPELLAVLSVHNSEEALLLCNGYKDSEYIELALLSRKIGRRTILIIEQFYELNLALETASKLGIEAEIGFRIKPHSQGSGLWVSSGGEGSKFGLHDDEILLGIDLLKREGKESWLKLLHFHIGSQIPSIDSIRKALRETSRIFVELAKLCPSLSLFDVGGGLGVDYDGTKSSADSSMDYSIEEYANEVVFAINSACTKAGVNHPIVISESGRALVAHHSLLVTEVIDVASPLGKLSHLEPPPSRHPELKKLQEFYQNLSAHNCEAVLGELYILRETILSQFSLGKLDFAQRAYAERAYRQLIAKIRLVSQELKPRPQKIEELEDKLLSLYFCNFSLFQSLPDAWAIKQLFPVMPIHRLDEEPTVRSTIVDLSCDSDGKIDTFPSSQKPSKFILLHDPAKSPYYLGVFLAGAYQEILGGLHNLFGDTHAIHIDLDEMGHWEFKSEIEGNTMSDVLKYVQYEPSDLIERLRLSIEKALREGRLTNEESAQLKRRFKKALESYTYLVV